MGEGGGAESKGIQHLLLICPKEVHRKFVQKHFKSSVLPSSSLKATNNIHKVSAVSEAPLGRLKEKKPPP